MGEGHAASLETRFPSKCSDGGVLGHGGQPSFSVFKERRETRERSLSCLPPVIGEKIPDDREKNSGDRESPPDDQERIPTIGKALPGPGNLS
jgi:hypothetical protein